MEIRANAVLVGVFAVGIFIAAIGFSIWLGRFSLDSSFNYYEVNFTGSVAGLSVGGDVRYNGIKVGSVTDLRLDPLHPERVKSLIQIEDRVAIREDTIARLQFQGVTGVIFIELSGGTPSAPVLAAMPGERYPVIMSRDSDLREIFSRTANTLKAADNLISKLSVLIESNEDALAAIVTNVEVMSRNVAVASADVEKMLKQGPVLISELEQTVAAMGRLADSADRFVSRDLHEVTGQYDALAVSLDQVVKNSQSGVRQLMEEGVPKFVKLTNRMTQVVEEVDRLVTQLNENPARYITGNTAPEYYPAEAP